MNTEMGKQSDYRAKLVRTLREQRSWTQDHLAQVTGLSERTIQRVESDGSASKESLLALAGAFGIDVEALSTEPTKKSEKLPSVKLLTIMKTGTDLLDLAIGSGMFQPSYSEPKDSETADLIGGLLGNLQDGVDIFSDMSIQQRIEFGMEMTDQLRQLEERNLLVFAHRRKVKMKSQNDPNFSMVTEIFTVVVTEATNPGIIRSENSVILPVVIENGPVV